MEKNCLYCNKPFTVKRRQVYCSIKCRYRNKTEKSGTRNIEFYSIETPCKCGCGQVLMNPDSHYRYRKFIPEHRNSNGTHPRLGYIESEEHIQIRFSKIRSTMLSRPTCLEVQLYSYLDTVGIVYEKQKQVGRTRPDAFIPQFKLCIYADGSFWHSRPENKERDSRANKICLERGFEYIRLPDKDWGYNLDLRPLQQYLLQNINVLLS